MRKYGHIGLYVLALLLAIAAGCGVVRSLGRDPDDDTFGGLDSIPNYKDGVFSNLADSLGSSVKHDRFLFLRGRPESLRPSIGLPWLKTNLKTLKAPAPTVVWFGHSSLLIKTEQGNILIDPVFSNHAGPVPGLVRAFQGTTHYDAEDMPPIDVLIISHDHYDHLDYRTVKKLKSQVKKVVVPLGLASSLAYWGVDRKKIVELNWGASTTLTGGLQITATPAQHLSNRTYNKKNTTLWASYVIQAGMYRLFYGGDGGYNSHFKDIGKQYGPFDLALLECGQFSPNKPWTHLLLKESAQAAVDLQAHMLQPIHWAKFEEAAHPWNEAIKALLPAAKKLNMPVTVPRIGEPYTVGTPPKDKVWWDFE